MPAANTPKREKFAQLVAAGKSYTEAFLESRPNAVMRRETAQKHGSALAKEPDVARRIAELREPVIKKVREQFKFTLDQAMEEIELTKVLARTVLKPEVILQGIKLQAQLAKLLGEGDKGKDASNPLAELSTEELLVMRDIIKAKRAARGSASSGKVSELPTKLKVV